MSINTSELNGSERNHAECCGGDGYRVVRLNAYTELFVFNDYAKVVSRKRLTLGKTISLYTCRNSVRVHGKDSHYKVHKIVLF